MVKSSQSSQRTSRKNCTAETPAVSRESFFPEMITSLPEGDIPLPGLDAYIVQSDSQQVLFMSFEEDAVIPEHSHEAQWGVILDGEIALTIGGREMIFRRGDSYFIPAGVLHSARIKRGYKDLTLFNSKDRFQAKAGG